MTYLDGLVFDRELAFVAGGVEVGHSDSLRASFVDEDGELELGRELALLHLLDVELGQQAVLATLLDAHLARDEVGHLDGLVVLRLQLRQSRLGHTHVVLVRFEVPTQPMQGLTAPLF